MEDIASDLAPFVTDPAGDLGIHLEVGLASSVDPLTQNDLDNYLEPLANHISHGRLVAAWVTKKHGDQSTLVLGSVEPTSVPLSGWMRGTAFAAGLSVPGKRELGRQIAQQAQPMPWGPIELEVAVRASSAEGWVRAWKPVIDSLVPILGRLPGKTEFDIEDGRVVYLALHGEVDRSLIHAVEVEVWWRAAERSETTAASPASLSYRVGPLAAGVPHEQSAPRLRGGKRRPRADPADWPQLDIALIGDLEQFRATQGTDRGFVVITDDANPVRIHRAGCSGVKEENFVRKVIQNGMRTGEYFGVTDVQVARQLWPALSEHSCV